MRVIRTSAQNFRSIRALTLDLTGFDCFVGPNNSGKSNLFDVFSFFADTATSSLGQAILMRDVARLRHYAAPDSEPVLVEAAVEMPAASQYKRVEYTLGFQTSPPIGLEREIVNGFNEPGKAITLLAITRTQHGDYTYRHRDGTQEVRRGTGMPEASLYSPDGHGDASPVLRFLNGFFSRFRHYKFVPDRLKLHGPATRVEQLAADGSNFASYLHTVQSGHRRDFDRIEDQLKKSFPDIEELLSPLSAQQQGTTEIGIREKWFKNSASGAQLSDGLAGFLAYLAVLYGPEEPTLVMFEEPENHIHPRLMERLVEMLRGASKDQQILLSTHSVSLVNRLSLENLVLVERSADGGTTARRVSAKEELRAALKDWALGEAYASGVLDAA